MLYSDQPYATMTLSYIWSKYVSLHHHSDVAIPGHMRDVYINLLRHMPWENCIPDTITLKRMVQVSHHDA